MMKSEIRNPKPEGNPKPEARNSKEFSGGVGACGVRALSLRPALALALCLGLVGSGLTKADPIGGTFTYPTNATSAWPDIDFNQDGTSDLSFVHYFVPPPTGMLGNIIRLDARGASRLEVLQDQFGRVQPLKVGDTVSLNPVVGNWQATAEHTIVWSRNERPLDIQVWGVGYSAAGDYTGIRFNDSSDWHYGWVQFGLLPSVWLDRQPGVLAYAFETTPGLAVTIPEPHSLTLWALAAGIGLATRRGWLRNQRAQDEPAFRISDFTAGRAGN